MQVADYLGSDLMVWSSAFWAAVQAEATPPVTRSHAHKWQSPELWLRAAPLVATLTPDLAAKLCDANPVVLDSKLHAFGMFGLMRESGQPYATPAHAALQAALDGAALRTYIGRLTVLVCSKPDDGYTGWVPNSGPDAFSSTLPQPGTSLCLDADDFVDHPLLDRLVIALPHARHIDSIAIIWIACRSTSTTITMRIWPQQQPTQPRTSCETCS